MDPTLDRVISPPAPAPRLSPMKRMAGLAFLLVVMVACAALGLWLRGPADQSAGPVVAPDVVGTALIIALGLFMMALGVGGYAIFVATNALTFRFDKSIMPSLGMRAWLCMLVFTLLFQIGFAVACSPGIVRLVGPALPNPALLPVALFGPMLAMQCAMISITPMAPIERRLIVRRLTALGCPPAQFPGGALVGTSDASRSSFKRFPIVEQDVGMLWLMPGRLVYRGDRESFDLAPQQVATVERKADAGSAVSFFGAVHVILHVPQPDGSTRKIRLHPEGYWTAPAKSRALNDLADRLWSWKASTATDAVTAPR